MKKRTASPNTRGSPTTIRAGEPILPTSPVEMESLRFTAVGDIPNIVARCRRTYQNRILFPLPKRMALLNQMATLLKEGEAELKAAVRRDLGKSGFECMTSEIGVCKNECFEAIDHLRKWAKPYGVDKPLFMALEDCHVHYDPLGVVLNIGAWNYPVQLSLQPLIGAMAAGNCCVLKPSEVSPETARVLTNLIAKYFDPSEFAVVNGGVAETTALLQEKFDHILYTGNSRVARIIMAAAAKNLTPVTLELGGKSPVIVDDNCDLRIAARRIAWGRLMNAGQTCVAPDYLLVKSNIKDLFIAELKTAFTEFLGTNPKQSPDYGRIVNEMHFKRICALMSGGKIVFGGETDPATRYISPTLLDDVDLNSELMHDEIFGPLLPIIPFNSIKEAIDFINARDKPLALYLFTKSNSIIKQVETNTSSGGMTINDTIMHATCPGLPFGGVGESGMGAYHAKNTFVLFSHKKSVMRRKQNMEVFNDLRYPPYSDKKLSQMQMAGFMRTGPSKSTFFYVLIVIIILCALAGIAVGIYYGVRE